jgi:TatD DNase family protein
MTYPRARRIREMAATLPLDAIVLETDAPDLPPEWRAGERNTPDQLPRIAQVLAELRSIPVQAVIEATTSNARNVLPCLNHLKETMQ